MEAFPESAHRPLIFDGWQHHRATLRYLVPIDQQWIGGSFVSAKLDPNDIDVCTFVDGPAYDALQPEEQSLVGYMCASKVTGAYWHCDSYAVVVYPEGSPGYDQYVEMAKYWHEFWGNTREDDEGKQRARGYLEVT